MVRFLKLVAGQTSVHIHKLVSMWHQRANFLIEFAPDQSLDNKNEIDQVQIELIKGKITVYTTSERIIGINCTLMQQYIEFVADLWLTELNCPKLYNVTNPFPFMDQISIEGKTNFFEKRVGEYKKARMCGTNEENVFRLDVEF